MINNKCFFIYNIIFTISISYIAIGWSSLNAGGGLTQLLDPALGHEQQIIENLSRYISMSDQIKIDLKKLANFRVSPFQESPKNKVNFSPDINYLFKYYPKLKESIPYVSFCDLPTPITRALVLEKELGVKNLFIKRDDLTGKKLADGSKLFGGNKPRKLEFLFADALVNNARSVLTFGCAGSNHAAATAFYAKELGLESILMLQPQVNSRVVRRNLLLDLYTNAEIIYSPSRSLRSYATITKFFSHKQEYGTFPYVIPTGASCPLGILGFVNAALELKEQINLAIMPEPTRIYVSLGSAGTIVGLLLGTKLADIKAKIIGITIEPEERPQEFLNKIKILFEETASLLNNADQNIPIFKFNDEDFEIIYNFCGLDYALFTSEGVAAIELLNKTENIKLDGVYTGKAFAGLLHDIKTNNFNNETILFWNTFSSNNFENILDKVDFRKLPSDLHFYFEEAVQELDR